MCCHRLIVCWSCNDNNNYSRCSAHHISHSTLCVTHACIFVHGYELFYVCITCSHVCSSIKNIISIKKYGWISNVWGACCLLQPIRPTSTHQKTPFVPFNLSLMHFTQDIKVSMKSFCAKTLKLTFFMP